MALLVLAACRPLCHYSSSNNTIGPPSRLRPSMARHAGHHAGLLGRRGERALSLDERHLHSRLRQRYWRVDPEATVYRQLHRQRHPPQHFIRNRPLATVQGTTLPKQDTFRQSRYSRDNPLRCCRHGNLDSLVNHRYHLKPTAVPCTVTSLRTRLSAHRRIHLLGVPTAKQK